MSSGYTKRPVKISERSIGAAMWAYDMTREEAIKLIRRQRGIGPGTEIQLEFEPQVAKKRRKVKQ